MSDTELLCGSLLMDVIPMVMAEIRSHSVRQQPRELSIAQFRAMGFIDRHPGTSMSKVAEFLGLTLSSVSKHVEKLVGLGYLVHKVCPGNRRQASLEASPKGKAVASRGRKQIARHLAERLSGLEPEALDTLAEGLRLLQRVFAPDIRSGPE